MKNCEVCRQPVYVSVPETKLKSVSPNDANYILACCGCVSKVDNWAETHFPNEIALFDENDKLIWHRDGPNLPKAITEQAATISKSGSDIIICCDDPDETDEIFEWLFQLIGKKYA